MTFIFTVSTKQSVSDQKLKKNIKHPKNNEVRASFKPSQSESSFIQHAVSIFGGGFVSFGSDKIQILSCTDFCCSLVTSGGFRKAIQFTETLDQMWKCHRISHHILNMNHTMSLQVKFEGFGAGYCESSSSCRQTCSSSALLSGGNVAPPTLLCSLSPQADRCVRWWRRE